jgi:hypothetical protein
VKSILLLLVLWLPLSAAQALDHLRVIWHDNPQTEAIIAWSSDRKGEGHRVYIDLFPHMGNLGDYKNSYEAQTDCYKATTDHRHMVRLKQLLPDTTYYFTITSNGEISREYHFKTAPSKNTNFRLLFGGDSRTDRSKRQEIHRLVRTQFEQNPEIYALVHGGDYIENGMSWKLWKEWLQDWQLTVTNNGRVLPIVPTRGNHEYLSPLYNDVFVRPGDEIYKNYYRTVIGSLSILTMNTNISHGGKQKRWLEKELKNAIFESPWIIANYHRPAWPAVKSAGRAQKHWVPLFEDFQLDLVFESDGHVLKKTLPIYRGKPDAEKGIIYVGEGGMGVPLRQPKKAGEWYLQSPGYAVSEYHISSLAVSPDKMTFRVHLLDGTLHDEQTLLPRKRKGLELSLQARPSGEREN